MNFSRDISAGTADATVSDFGHHLGYWLHFVAAHVSARHDLLLKDRGMTVTESLVLRTLVDEPCLPHHSLTRLLGTTRTATWKTVRRLEESGFIHRQLAPGRARLQGLTLTVKGEALIPELAAVAEDNEFHFFSQLSPSLRNALIGTLRALAARHQFGFRQPPRRVKNRPGKEL